MPTTYYWEKDIKPNLLSDFFEDEFVSLTVDGVIDLKKGDSFKKDKSLYLITDVKDDSTAEEKAEGTKVLKIKAELLDRLVYF